MKKNLTATEVRALLDILNYRFVEHLNRHKGIAWEDVVLRLKNNNEKMWALRQMEDSGGAPDVVELDKKSGTFIFFDCAAESPAGRRSLCYDNEALASRKAQKPRNSACGMAAEMGVRILSEDQYRYLQTLGSFDTKTSSWVLTPPALRDMGGALFCDRRYNTVFVYHNGAESYYAARGFRAWISV